MGRIKALSNGSKLLLVSAIALFLNLSLTWQRVEVDFGTAGQGEHLLDGWDAWGLLIGLLTLTLITLVVVVLLTDIEISDEVPWDRIVFGLAGRQLAIIGAAAAGVWFLYKTFGRRYGGSTGTNLYGALQIASQMKDGSIVSLLCDSGDRYLHTYYDDGWVEKMGFDIQPYLNQLDRFFQSGEWFEIQG